jgi:predicted SnoaL-like aldol condensation-catalyzing enzyme
MSTSDARHFASLACDRRTALHLGSGGLVTAFALSGVRATQAQELPPLEANKALVRRVFEEIVNSGNAVVVDEVYAPTFVDLSHAARHSPRPAGIPLPLDEFRSVLPDIVATIEDVIAEGALVATRVTWRNVHPPAGTHIEGCTMHLSRIVKGQIVEEWSVGWEWLDHLTQLLPHPNPLMTP